jgi:NAD-dependent deacetylase
MMPILARESGARVVEINPEPTPLTRSISDYLIQGEAGEVLDAIVACIAARRSREMHP